MKIKCNQTGFTSLNFGFFFLKGLVLVTCKKNDTIWSDPCKFRHGFVQVPGWEVIQCVWDDHKRKRLWPVRQREFDVSHTYKAFVQKTFAVRICILHIIWFNTPCFRLFFIQQTWDDWACFRTHVQDFAHAISICTLKNRNGSLNFCCARIVTCTELFNKIRQLMSSVTHSCRLILKVITVWTLS